MLLSIRIMRSKASQLKNILWLLQYVENVTSTYILLATEDSMVKPKVEKTEDLQLVSV